MMSPIVHILPRLTLQVVRTGGDQFHIPATEVDQQKAMSTSAIANLLWLSLQVCGIFHAPDLAFYWC